jgi:thioredoxin 1
MAVKLQRSPKRVVNGAKIIAMPYTAAFVPETLSRAEVDATAGPLVLEFGTNWCGWCQGAQPHIEAAFAQAGEAVPHVKVEDGPGRPLGRSFRVKLWPTLIFLKDGAEVARLVRPGGAEDVASALRQLTEAKSG